jgi:cysteine desulfurase
MAKALELWHADRDAHTAYLTELRDRLWAGLQRQCSPVLLIGHPTRRLPNTLNIAFPGCDGEALLVALDLAEVGCSLGSTCASGAAEIAPILQAMQVPTDLARGCLRFTLGIDNTPQEIDEAIARISDIPARSASK